MVNRWKGNFIIATGATSDGTNYTGKANGAWGLNSQLQQKKANLWAKSVGNPSAPTIGTVTPAAGAVSVAFTTSSDTGGGTLTYTATSSPGGYTNTGASSPILVSGLTNGTSYTFTVKATNSYGYVSADSSPSSAAIPSADVIAIGTQVSPFVTAYSWANGFGSKFSDPATLPVSVGLAQGLTFNSTNTAIISAYGYGTNAPSEYLAANNFSTSSGFGTKLTAPATPPAGESRRCTMSPNGSYLAVPHTSTPFISVYNWSNGFGTKLSNPGTLPAGVLAYGCGFSPSGNALAVLSNTEGCVYSWSGGFGTKYSMGSLGTPSNGNIAFSPAGTEIVASINTTPYIKGFPWTGSSFGTAFSNPATAPSDFNYPAMAFSSSNNQLIFAEKIYNWSSSGFGSLIGSTIASPAVTSQMSAFNSSSTVVARGIDAYNISAGGLGSQFAAPSVLPNIGTGPYGSTCFTK